MTTILKKIGFKGGDVDPCLYRRQDEDGLVFVALYVDDNLMVGHPNPIQKTIKELQANGLTLKVEDNLCDYLSCGIIFSSNHKKAWLGQPHLISKLEQTFENQVQGLRKYKTPGTPGLNMIRNEDQNFALDQDKHKLFRSGVGMLLYLVKHSRPDIANCV